MKCGVNASVKGGCFLRTPACSGIVRRLCGWLGASGTHDFESSEALEEQPAVARSAVERGAASMLRMLAPVTRCARLRDQLQLDDETNSKIADGYATGSSARRKLAVAYTLTTNAKQNLRFSPYPGPSSEEARGHQPAHRPLRRSCLLGARLARLEADPARAPRCAPRCRSARRTFTTLGLGLGLGLG